MPHSLLVLPLLLVLVGAAWAQEPLPEPVRETFTCSTDGSRWPYLLQMPPGEPSAILIYLHGHYADEYQGMTEGGYNDAFGKLRRECLKRGWAYLTCWYGGNTWMGPLAESGLADLIGALRQRWPGRPVYLCGGSMGGSSVLVFAVRQPELVDGLIALCPASDVEAYYAFASGSDQEGLRSIAAAIRLHYQTGGGPLAEELQARSALAHADHLRMPVYLSHGAQDAVIPVGPTRALAARLAELGRVVRYVELPAGDHDSPVLAIDWPAALDFVFSPRPAR